MGKQNLVEFKQIYKLSQVRTSSGRCVRIQYLIAEHFIMCVVLIIENYFPTLENDTELDAIIVCLRSTKSAYDEVLANKGFGAQIWYKQRFI